MRRVLNIAAILGIAACCIPVSNALASPVLPTLNNISMGVGEQLPNGFSGVGARAMGMGGAHLSMVQDGSALFWNPAALTRVRRMELLGGLGQMQPSSKAEVGVQSPVSRSESANFTTLNAAVLSIPYPAYRGGLTFAVGVNRPWDYGYRSLREGRVEYDGTAYTQSDRIRQEGGMRGYSLGMGLEVSEEISIGLSTTWYRGSVDVRRDLSLQEISSVALPDSLIGVYKQNNDIKGFGFMFGTTARLPFGLTMAAVAVPPITFEHEGAWGDAYYEWLQGEIDGNIYSYQENRLKYKIKTPWQLGVGFSWASYAVALTTDIWYIDWTQARYEGAPYDASTGINSEEFFEDRYNTQIRVHIGGEFLLPVVDTHLRLGYYHNADPFEGPVLDTSESLRYVSSGNYFTVGLGRLFGQVMALDVAYVYGGDEVSLGAIREKRTASKVYATVAYRL